MLRSLSKSILTGSTSGRYGSGILRRTAATKGGDSEKEESLASPASPLREDAAAEFFQRSDAAQRKFMEIQRKGERQTQKVNRSKTPDEMPPDLHAFLSSTRIVETTVEMPTSPRPRLPRHLRNEDDTEDHEVEENQRPVSEKMPIMEKVTGFDTVRTTNFSRRKEKITSRIYKAADALSIYELLRRKNNTNQAGANTDQADGDGNSTAIIEAEIAEQVYREYGKSHELPSEEFQKFHKELLTNTLKYLDLPILMRDTEDENEGFFGVHPEDREQLRMFQEEIQEVPEKVAKWVLEDLSDIKKTTNN